MKNNFLFKPRFARKKADKVKELNIDNDLFSQYLNYQPHKIDVKNTIESKNNDDNDWFSQDFEGQLSVDVYQNKESIIVKSTIAGVNPSDLDIFLENDILTIRGKRVHNEQIRKEDYFFQECYWGGFSRTIILPIEIRYDKIEASLDNGILTIILPKIDKSKKIHIKSVNSDF